MWIVFFLSLFSFISSSFFLFFSFLFLFFETEILVAQADLETEYIVDNNLELLIHLSSAGILDVCHHAPCT